MTEMRAPRGRWSKNGIRAIAWLSGGATLFASGAVLAASPKPDAAAADGTPRRQHQAHPRRVIERHVIRRVIVYDVPTSSSYGGSGAYYASGGSSSGGSSVGSSGSSSSGGSSGGGSSGGGGAGGGAVAPPPAPPPPPPTGTGGSGA